MSIRFIVNVIFSLSQPEVVVILIWDVSVLSNLSSSPSTGSEKAAGRCPAATQSAKHALDLGEKAIADHDSITGTHIQFLIEIPTVTTRLA